ncbi:amidohydrolase family protein [Acuticoccus yangtzensis]|uniref:amidohydrolase family protein n=1 Tax=Acuticoccus yangtzensis TaxID=1443441 RepID=UPI0009495747|nr:amidohydrolase family protein [Acuticoccus yangtzensis]ORE90919.1 transcriptional regulator, GntR family/amidohydrolase family protein [Stappia sp. 22II-S9-Z10]
MSVANTTPDIPAPVAEPKKPDHILPAGSCDCHAHIFGPAERYPYAAERDYTPHDAPLSMYAGLLHHLGFSRAVLVQASVYGTDNSQMADALEAAKSEPHGIEWRGIAVLPESVSDAELERLNGLGVRGARLNLLNKGAGLSFDDVKALADRLAPLDWHLQFLIDISTFADFRGRMSRLPVTSVIDHIGHFPGQLGPQSAGFQDLLALVREGRTWVKVSGPNRFARQPVPPYDDAVPLTEALVEAAPDQLVFGTDWPHVRLKTPMPDDGALVDEFMRWIGNDAAIAQRILVDNPARLYGF